MEDELELGRPVASGATKNTESDGSGSTDESRAGSDSDETSDGARAEANRRPLALKTVVPEHPSETAYASREVRHDARLGRTQVCGEGGAAVEAKPAKPEEDGAQDNVGSVVRLVREALGAVAPALAEVDGDGERGGPGRDVDGRTSREVKAAELERPPIGVPSPAGNGVVNDRRPDEHEDHDRPETTTLSNGANGDHGTARPVSLETRAV